MFGDVSDNTAHSHKDGERGAAVADEWQRDAGKRDEAGDGGDINKSLQSNYRSETDEH